MQRYSEYWGILMTSTSLGSSRRKVLEDSPKKLYQRNKTSTPKTVFYYAPASWHSNFLHICFQSFTILMSDAWVFFIPPKTELSNIRRNICATANRLSRFSPPFIVYILGVQRKSSERYSCHFGTTAVIMVIFFLTGYTNLVWSHAKCYSINYSFKVINLISE